MELSDRLTRIHPLPGGGLLASDVRGRLHLLDEHLQLVSSSPVVSGGLPTYCLMVDGNTAVTKDRSGTVTKWRLDPIEPAVALAAHELRSPASEYLKGEEPSPSINRGIAVWQGRVYVNNGYLQVVVLDLETFEVLQIAEPFSPVYLEWICTDRPGQQAVSDKTGRLYLGDLASLDFPVEVRIDGESNVHRVLFDPLHDRYWATQDAGDSNNLRIANGLVTVLPDGTIEETLRFAADDIECLAFSADFTRAYTGGFDGDLHIFDNTRRELKIAQTVHAFSHEIIDLAVLADDTLAVLSQDGQLAHLTSDGVRFAEASYRSQCVWDAQPVPGRPGRFRLGTDTGVQTVEVRESIDGPYPVLVEDWRTGTGFVRSLAVSADATYCVSHQGQVFRLDDDGKVVWRQHYFARLHTVALDRQAERLLVASNEGAVEHLSATGERTAKFDLGGRHAWVACYLATGERVVATHEFDILVFAADSEQLLWSLKLEGYPKRMWASDEDLFVTGGGGVRQISLRDREVVRLWDAMLENTVENFVFHGEHLYALSYGCQIGVYDANTCEGLGLIEQLPDFPKGLALLPAEEGPDHLLVGGRGGYLQVRRLQPDGDAVLVRTVHLPR